MQERPLVNAGSASLRSPQICCSRTGSALAEVRCSEAFAFERFETELGLHCAGELVLLDCLRLEPEAQVLRSPAELGECAPLRSIHRPGPRATALADQPI